MANTDIAWTDKVWNPVTGCEKISPGCKHCYAASMAKRFWGQRQFMDVQCHEDRLTQPLHWRKPCKVFVNSMSDLFHEQVPGDFIVSVLRVIEQCPQHTFMVLTKRSARMRDFYWGESGAGADAPAIPNLWLGVSVEDQATADERIPLLLQTPAAVRFVSAEPLLGAVDLTALGSSDPAAYPFFDALRGKEAPGAFFRDARIRWVIVGCESGPGARDWPEYAERARSIISQCKAAGVAVFHKQMPVQTHDGWRISRDMTEWPDWARVQEFPK